MSVESDLLFTARNIVNQLFDEAGVDVDTRQRINDKCDNFVFSLLQAKIDWSLVSEGLPEKSGLYWVCDFTDSNRPNFLASWFDADRDKPSFNYHTATHWKLIILPEEDKNGPHT